MGRKKPVNKDVAQKIFFKSPERFADICNGILYEGNEYIHAEDLDELDSDVSDIIQGKFEDKYLERRRDVVKRVRDGTIVTIVGIENQASIHYAMPLRIISYDVLGYVDEAKQIAVKRRKEKRKESSAEFLSGFGKEDRLTPIITIVLYYGEEPWDGPRNFREMLGEVRTEVEKYIPDYSLNIVELRGDKEYHFQNEEIENLFKISRACLNRDKEELEKIKNIEVGSELASMLGTILKSKTLLERPNKEGMVKMCTLFDEIEKTGYEKGEKSGYEKGEKSGYEKGEMYGIYGIINAMRSMDAPADKIIGQLMIQMKLSKKEAQSYIKKHYNN